MLGECILFYSQGCQSNIDGYVAGSREKGKGTLKWFPFTVIKDLKLNGDGKLIERAIAIQHSAAPGTAPLNTEPLSQTIDDAYRYENSPRLAKKIIQFVPANRGQGSGVRGQESEENSKFKIQNSKFRISSLPTPHSPLPTPWIVIDATETGELIALADVPYQVGLDPRTYLNPSSPTPNGYPYCLQGYTYTFAMERTAEPQPQQMPSFYPEYEAYYGYDTDPKKADFEYVFTYRRIWNPKTDKKEKAGPFTLAASSPGSISMQNWVWGNDYRPGTERDNLVFDRYQLQQAGQLSPAVGWVAYERMRFAERRNRVWGFITG